MFKLNISFGFKIIFEDDTLNFLTTKKQTTNFSSANFQQQKSLAQALKTKRQIV